MARETAEEKRKRLAGASTIYKTTPEEGDVSATGPTGPNPAPHSGRVISEKRRKAQFTLKAKTKKQPAKEPGALAWRMGKNGKVEYWHGDTKANVPSGWNMFGASS